MSTRSSDSKKQKQQNETKTQQPNQTQTKKLSRNQRRKLAKQRMTKQTKFQTGIVNKWYDLKGYGFITCDDGSGNLFVHRSEITDGKTKALHIDQAVKFEIITSDDAKRKGTPMCYAAA